MSEAESIQLTPAAFHGRRSEVDQIVRLATAQIDERRSQVLLMEGPGGIGKSMLLRRAIDELKAISAVQCVGPIDMDDTDYRVPTNMGLSIASDLDAASFANYLEGSQRYQSKQLGKVDQQTVIMHMNSTDKLFVSDYLRFTSEHRVAIFVDTIESVRHTYMWTYFMRLIAMLPNTLFVLAGRPGVSDGQETERPRLTDQALKPFYRMPIIGQDGAHLIRLVGWSKKDARDFILKTELGQEIPYDWAENILYLSRCQPLHITLAIERPVEEIAAAAPLYFPTQGKEPRAEEQEGKAPDVDFADLSVEGRQLCKDFERSLLTQHSGTGRWAEAIQRIAHIRRRLDRGMYERVMAFEPAVQDRPEWNELRRQTWIRQRAGGYITLHDVVSELMRRYIWPMRDPDGLYRRQLSQQALVIYDDEIARHQSQFTDLRQQFETKAAEFSERLVDESSELTELMRHMLEINRRLWVLEAERLYYQLDADLEKGYKAFSAKFDQASRESRLGLREMLLLEIQGYLSRFPEGGPGHYKIRVCEAQVAIDDGEAERGYRILTKLQELYRTPKHQYELLRLQGNASIRMPRSEAQALSIFEKALDLTRHNEELYHLEGEALMEIGWTYRQFGQWEKAADFYAQALSVTPLSDRTLLARIETSLAYVEGLIGNYATAETLIQDALTTHRRQSPPERVGATLSVMGEIFRYQGQFDKAYQAFEEALSIFTDAQDFGWIGQIRQQMAIALIQDNPEANISDAKYNAESGLFLCREYNARAYASALQRAARVYTVAGELTRALDVFAEGIQVAQAVSDNWFLAANCVERAELAYRLWTNTGREEFRSHELSLRSSLRDHRPHQN
jgi:tetratricopeptide (TPR) repeat protein